MKPLFCFMDILVSQTNQFMANKLQISLGQYNILENLSYFFCCWLNKLRNTQGTIYGTYLGNIYIYIYGIYTEYIRNIHKYLWYKIIRNTGAAFGGRPIGSVFLIILYHKYLWIFLIYSLYIPYIFPEYVPYIFPCVFLNLWSQE